jgi:hypothetical protein
VTNGPRCVHLHAARVKQLSSESDATRQRSGAVVTVQPDRQDGGQPWLRPKAPTRCRDQTRPFRRTCPWWCSACGTCRHCVATTELSAGRNRPALRTRWPSSNSAGPPLRCIHRPNRPIRPNRPNRPNRPTGQHLTTRRSLWLSESGPRPGLMRPVRPPSEPGPARWPVPRTTPGAAVRGWSPIPKAIAGSCSGSAAPPR